jgi:DNA-binding protein YbaB
VVQAVEPEAGRPNWSVLDDMVGDLRKALREAEDTQRRVLSVTATAWSDDRMIRAVVGPRGHLVELEIDPRVYRKPNSAALAATILATVRDATDQVLEQTQQILDENIPSDMRVERIGSFDVHRLLRTHDADLHDAVEPARPDPAHADRADSGAHSKTRTRAQSNAAVNPAALNDVLSRIASHDAAQGGGDPNRAGPRRAGPNEEDRRD